MKQTVIVTGPELQQAVATMVGLRPQFRGKHIAAVHLIADPDEPKAELKIRAQVVLFDTAKSAEEYGQPNTAPSAAPDADKPKEPTA